MSSRQERKEELRAQRVAAERAAAAAQARRRRLGRLGAVGAAAAAIVVVLVLVSGGGGHRKSPPPSGGPVPGAAQVARLMGGIPQRGIALGSPRAPVTLTEFADLKCPVCRQYDLAVLPGIVQRYVRPGKVRLMLRLQHFVGDQNGDSEHAARMAVAAGLQNRLWQFAELFYVNQQDETTTYAGDAFLTRLGGAVAGLDVRRALAQRGAPAVTRELAQAARLYAAGGFSGTPSFLIGRTGGPSRELGLSFTPSDTTGALDRLLKG